MGTEHRPQQPQTAQQLIKRLGLVRHPEGGWFRETYRSSEQLHADALPTRFGGNRVISTAIYFMLVQGEISALHRIKSDELWHYHAGSALVLHVIAPDGRYQQMHLGPDIVAGDHYQVVIPAESWFGAELKGEGFSLVGCTVAPGFDFTDFEMGCRHDLLKQYPQHAGMVTRMTLENCCTASNHEDSNSEIIGGGGNNAKT